MDMPTLELETPFGRLDMTILDDTPTDEDRRQYMRQTWGATDPKDCPPAPAARVRGEITVNRVTLKIDAAFSWQWTRHEAGRELDTPRYEVAMVYASSYNRRADGGAWDYSAGYASRVRTELAPVVQAALEANPGMVVEARAIARHERADALYAQADALTAKAAELRKQAEALKLEAMNAGAPK